MSAKRKATPLKKKWQAMRARYTWHLPPPSDRSHWPFDYSHWWNKAGQAKVKPEAALYELARRHPLVNETPPRQVPLPGFLFPGVAPATLPSFLEPRPSLRLTQRLGMKSWPKLTAPERRNWRSSIGMMKGFDFRPVESRSIDITRQADLKISQQRISQIALLKNTKTYCGFAGMYAEPAEPTDQEREAAISQCAVEAHRQGYALIAVAPNLAAGKAGNAMVKQYREHGRLYPQAKQRARWEDWLLLIASFEDAETSHKAYAQEFARYRRAVDGIQFA
jgi:hypothetical protein